MAQRNRYRVGKRSRRQRENYKSEESETVVDHLLNHELPKQEIRDMKEQQNKSLVQVETGGVSDDNKVIDEMVRSTEQVHEAPSLLATDTTVEKEGVEQNLTEEDTVEYTESVTTNTSKASGVGKSAITIAVLAVLIGGGYYYAKEQGFIGDKASGTVADTTITDVSAVEPVATQEQKTDVSTVEPVVTQEQKTEASMTPPENTSMHMTPTQEGASIEASDQASDSTVVHESVSDVTLDKEVTTLAETLKQQEQQIAQLTEQLKEAQKIITHQQTQTEHQQVLRKGWYELTRLYQLADFERTVRVSKENTLKALAVLEATLASEDGEIWQNVRQAVRQDVDILKESKDINLDQLFKTTEELVALIKVAPFVSAEGGQGVITSVTPSTVEGNTAQDTSVSWFDKVINRAEKLPTQAYDAIRSDLGGLIKVEKLSNPQNALLSIEQIQQLRTETLRQLSIAQEALLKHQQDIWDKAIQKVEQLLTAYYNTNVAIVQQALELTHQLEKVSVVSPLPELKHTQQALEQLAHQFHLNN